MVWVYNVGTGIYLAYHRNRIPYSVASNIRKVDGRKIKDPLKPTKYGFKILR